MDGRLGSSSDIGKRCRSARRSAGDRNRDGIVHWHFQTLHCRYKRGRGQLHRVQKSICIFFLIQSVVWFQSQQLLLVQSVSFFLHWGIPSIILHQIGTEGNSFQLNRAIEFSRHASSPLVYSRETIIPRYAHL